MAEFANESELWNIVKDFMLVNDGDKTVKVQVVFIEKYFKDRTNALVLENNQNLYFYDLMITDGKGCLRALLHPKLFHLVENNEVRKTSVCLIALNVERVKNETYLVIVKMQLLAQTSEHFPQDLLNLITATYNSNLNRETTVRPLIGVRHFFVNMWNDCIIEWPLRDPDDIPFIGHPFSDHIRSLIDRAKTSSLLDIENARGPVRQNPPILVRVMSITKVKRFGGVTDANECSLQAMAYVTDGTAIAFVSIWNSVIASLHDKISVGSAIIFNNYTITPLKPGFNTQTKFSGVHFAKRLKLVSFEIKINPVFPSSLSKTGHPIYVFNAPADLNLPTFPFYVFKFFTSFEESLAVKDTNWIDIAGVVVSLSRYERCRQNDGTFVYRWIEIFHWPDKPPVRVLLYVNSQIDVHRQLSIGDKVIACNLRLVEPESPNAETFFVNSQHTFITILTPKNQRYFLEHRSLINLYKLSSVSVRKYLKCGNGYGGLYIFPLKLTKFEDSEKTVIFKGGEWYGVIDQLRFWVRRRIFAAGRIIRVDYISLHSDAPRKNIYSDSSVVLESFLIFGLNKPHPNSFPHRFRSDVKSRTPLQFPETSSVTPTTTNKTEDLFLNASPSDFNINGYYEITIACENSQTALRCFFIPQPAINQHPTFIQLISGDYTMAAQETPIEPRPTYSDMELNVCTETARQIPTMSDSTFLVDLFKHSESECEIVLIRRFDTTELLTKIFTK